MPSPHRLEQLRRQRALLQEHLAWLDREIAGEMTSGRPTGSSGPAPAPSGSGYRPPLPPGTALPASSVSPVSMAAPGAAPLAAGSGTGVNIDELFDQLRADDRRDNAPPSKTGCWIAFAVILLFLISATGVLILFLYR